MIIALKQSVETWASQGRKPIDQYEPGSISQESSTQILALAATPVISFRQENSEQSEAAWASEEYYAFTLPQQRETQGVWQAIGGVIFVGVGVLCIVATAGAATPLVVAGAVAGGGTILFGGAEIMEGSQNIYYGATGDMQSSAFNPIRDTVFLGNQGVYDFTKNAFVFAAGAMIPIGSAYSAGTLTLRSGSVIVAAELLSEGAGFAVSKAGEAMDLNPTATMLLSIAASMGTSAGLGKLDQAYNVSGSFPKIDVTAQNPASMIGDIDGVPTSTGIDVPGAKVDDAIEGIGKVEGASKTGKFNNWDDMKETYKGTVTKFITENKPKEPLINSLQEQRIVK